MDFDELTAQVFKLHAAGGYAAALDLIADPGAEAERMHGATLAHWRACFLSLLDRPSEALDELRRATADGRWWAPSLLEADPDLERARGEEGFGAIVAESERRWRNAVATSKDEPVSVVRPGGSARAIVVVLHGGRGSVEDIAPTWAAAGELGCIVAIPGRGQLLMSDGDFRNWMDPERTGEALCAAVEAVSEASVPLVIVGFSAGGREAFRIGLSGDPVETAGIIAFAPGPLDPATIDLTRAPGLRAWLFVGEDDWVLDGAVHLVEELRAHGSAVSFTQEPGLGHDLPSDLPDRLSVALDHVLGA